MTTKPRTHDLPERLCYACSGTGEGSADGERCSCTYQTRYEIQASYELTEVDLAYDAWVDEQNDRYYRGAGTIASDDALFDHYLTTDTPPRGLLRLQPGPTP